MSENIMGRIVDASVGMMVNVGVNAMNWFIKVYGIKNIFGVLVIANVNVIKLVMLDNI